ncbi:MAG: hypothetical protein MHM6MM_005054 [Cercozoa sp. M6MM]
MSAEKPVCLLISFLPFRNRQKNGSSTLASHVQSDQFQIVHTALPVVWKDLALKVDRLVRQYQPRVCLGMGECPSSNVKYETQAVNKCEGRDEDGFKNDVGLNTVCPSETVRYGTCTFDGEIEGLVLSRDAGAYLCNALLWTLLSYARRDDEHSDSGSGSVAIEKVGFLHVPEQGDTSDEDFLAAHLSAVEAFIRSQQNTSK